MAFQECMNKSSRFTVEGFYHACTQSFLLYLIRKLPLLFIQTNKTIHKRISAWPLISKGTIGGRLTCLTCQRLCYETRTKYHQKLMIIHKGQNNNIVTTITIIIARIHYPVGLVLSSLTSRVVSRNDWIGSNQTC